jgi:hypothetical protein
MPPRKAAPSLALASVLNPGAMEKQKVNTTKKITPLVMLWALLFRILFIAFTSYFFSARREKSILSSFQLSALSFHFNFIDT